MRLGCGLPMLGAVAGPDAITRGAQRAEALGYHSVWVADRLLYPRPAPRSLKPPLDDAKRTPLSGSVAQVRGDLARLGDAGVTEVIAWTGAPTLDGFLAGLERFREAAG